jgi:hypothetical protein
MHITTRHTRLNACPTKLVNCGCSVVAQALSPVLPAFCDFCHGLLRDDVLTSLEAGNANAAVPDNEVLAFARSEGRILLSHNRRHFIRLHQHRVEDHPGIVVCSLIPTSSHKRNEFTKRWRLCQKWTTN